jgi:hypothetical protein
MTGVLPADPEAAYYQTIEEHFVSRRGDPLFLSNADWFLMWRWRQAGIPLRVVLRGITDALDAHDHSWGRGRKVERLAYCTGEVEAARDRWQQALSLGQEERLRPETFLRQAADGLAVARSLGPRASGVARELCLELHARADGIDGERLSTLEAWLGSREKALLEALRADGPAEHLGEIEAEVERDLSAYRDRMPAKILEQVRTESVTRRLLESHGLRRLSLFHLA